MAMWNPWRGCHRCSEGCRFCYIHKGDARRGVDTGDIRPSAKFDAPLGMKGNQTVYVCFSSDFLLPEADAWRPRCWQIMRRRPDLHFLFLTKRIHRLEDCLPSDWGSGYENVTIGCTVEHQAAARERLPIFTRVPIRHRNIVCQPMLGPMDLTGWLEGTELVIAGGEADRNARPLDYNWVLELRRQCVQAGVAFLFRQCGTYFLKDGVRYRLKTRDLAWQARRAGIDYAPQKKETTAPGGL